MSTDTHDGPSVSRQPTLTATEAREQAKRLTTIARYNIPHSYTSAIQHWQILRRYKYGV